MKFIVEKTKSGMFEDEYTVTVPEKTKERLRKVAFFSAIFGPTVYIAFFHKTSPKTENNEETIESP